MTKPTLGDASFDIRWVDRKCESQCAPNPAYPLGIDLDLSQGATKTCKSKLPYPAKRIGFYLVKCNICDFNAVITTAGRVDDPRSVTLACWRRQIKS